MQFRVKDFMSKNIKSISPDMNAKDALKMLIENDLSGLPVIDERGDVVGVFTEREILKVVLPVYVRQVGTFVYGGDSKSAIKKILGLEQHQVKDFMRKEISTIDAEASLSEASKMMLTKAERRIIVMENKRVVGVITRCDVIKGFAEEAGILK